MASYPILTSFFLFQLAVSIQGQEFVEVPQCPANEFLTSNGTELYCKTLHFLTVNYMDVTADGGFCDCPDLFPVCENGSAIVPTFPLPPPGCEQFEPPIRGAFVCLRRPTVIYCSVLCDHRFEFFTTPHNPYTCGEDTGFVWRDVVGTRVDQGLPTCAGFRHRLQTLYSDDHYLPAPCYGLNDNTIAAILRHFHISLDKVDCEDCELEDTFLRCPKVPASARHFDELSIRDDYHK